MILVTGAAGKTGKAVIKALAGRGAEVRALVRHPEHVGALTALGAAEIALGSFETSWRSRPPQPACGRFITSAQM